MRWRLWFVVLWGVLFGCSRSDTEAGPSSFQPPPTTPPAATPEQPAPPPSSTCEPQTCFDVLGKYGCGVITDSCGNPLDCGGCSGDQTCGGGGTPNHCATPPQVSTCTALEGRERQEPVSGGIQGMRECFGGWCSNNSYMGNDVEELWGFSETDAWAVGGQQHGVALHWNGKLWTQVALPSPEPLRAVWGAAPNDVWAAGAAGTLLRWNGATWRRIPAPTSEVLTGISGTSADDVWLVGPRVALHWDGTRLREALGWTSLPVDPDEDIVIRRTRLWAIGPNDVVAAGGSVCQRWNGKAWSRMDCGVQEARDVWASGPDDVWVVGSHALGFSYISERAHWDGQKWNRICQKTPQDLLWGTRSGQLFGHSQWNGLTRFNGQTWTLTAATRLGHPTLGRALTGSTWGVGSNGSILRFDGQRWSGSPSTLQYTSLFEPFGTSPEDVWAISSGSGLYHWDGQQWLGSSPVSMGVVAGWALGPDNVFVVSRETLPEKLWRWSGTSWVQVLELGTDQLEDMWGSGPDDVWAVGWSPPPEGTASCEGCEDAVGVAWHWDGQRWTRVYAEPGHSFTRIFGTSRSNVWVLDYRKGDTPTTWALRWDGSTFQRTGEFQDTYNKTPIAGTGPEDLWLAAGQLRNDHTRMYHFDGKQWTEQESLPGHIIDMGAVPGQRTFATTEDGIIYERSR
ncbi:WD40/YVTN/BNR-like repeat-containing protein [Hyalangium versicolor]|uniref:WD40/YVTN/BNR-like repeat-containing protein n=1 Tax=Hyalangium versicolor TaxID=2861190 RepID=UPI001CCEA16C|nr:hypothetical protein [Hyalangium versicolor]